jgi:diaminohydroxyphosphoribosylaminopyrimidine deaminase/5-amino-6-(5-phosphoribosylamino)uracil reductase
MVEGGSRVATAFLRARAVDRIVCFVACALLGEGIPTVGPLGITTVDRAIRLTGVTVDRAGDDLVIAGHPAYEATEGEEEESHVHRHH